MNALWVTLKLFDYIEEDGYELVDTKFDYGPKVSQGINPP